MMLKHYLKETRMLNYNHPLIKKLIKEKNWNQLSDFDKIKSIYEYVQNDILFGYNTSDTLTSTEVLIDRMGQCNTKSTHLMSLLRAVEIPCRLHGLEVEKDFQRGATSFPVSTLAPKYIVHTWVEVYYEEEWYALEGVILDKAYLQSVQAKYTNHQGPFKKYAIATKDLNNPSVEWNGSSTYIQKEAVVNDFGTFSSPDSFFKQHNQHLSKLKQWLYTHLGRKIMNRNVKRMRNTLYKEES